MATVMPCKNVLYFGFTCSYLKNELGESNFLFHKRYQQAKIKLSAMFKKKFSGAYSELPYCATTTKFFGFLFEFFQRQLSQYVQNNTMHLNLER